jgi:uncharacterized RDD family membrane protein YckC
MRLEETFYYCAGCHPARPVAGSTAMSPAAPESMSPLEDRQPLPGRPVLGTARADATTASSDSSPALLTASLGRRGLALFVDAMLVGFVVNLVLALARNLGATPTFLIIFGFSLVYEALFVQHGGQTIGKSMAGVEVVSATGGPVSDTQAWLRAFVKVIQLGCCGTWFLLAAISDQRLGLHDWLARTRVVRRTAEGLS